MDPIIVIGTGLAGYSFARELRKRDATTPLLFLTADDGHFYAKPMLSNAFAKGKTPDQLINADAAAMARELRAEILTHTRVDAIDTHARTVTAGTATYGYRQLVLALGARANQPPFPGADALLSVNGLADYRRFFRAVAAADHVAVIGAGLIGCEFANDLRAARKQVTVIGHDPLPLGRLLPAAAAEVLRDGLAAAGVQWRLGAAVQQVEQHAAGLRIATGDGALDVDCALAAIGLQPLTELAQAAGLAVNRGICVDHQLRTSAPEVYALGDCAEVHGRVLPFVLPLMEQARVLAAVIAGGEATLAYPPMPVVIKTPACPVVVAPPPPAAKGEWQINATPGAVHGEFRDAERLLGFVLTGTAVSARQPLTKALAA